MRQVDETLELQENHFRLLGGWGCLVIDIDILGNCDAFGAAWCVEVYANLVEAVGGWERVGLVVCQRGEAGVAAALFEAELVAGGRRLALGLGEDGSSVISRGGMAVLPIGVGGGGFGGW